MQYRLDSGKYWQPSKNVLSFIRLSFLAMAALFMVVTVGVANAQFPVRPSEYSSSCANNYADPPAAYDGSLTTASYASIAQYVKGAVVACETWYGFPSESGTQMNLNVSTSAQVSGTPGKSGGEVQLLYSLDGGSTWTPFYTLFNNGQLNQQTYSVALSNSQDLTKIQIEGRCVASVGYVGYSASCQQGVYEIWVSGT